MDTVFKIINKDEIYFGADHFGYDDSTLTATYYLVKLAENNIKDNEYNFLKENLYKIDGSNVQDIEVIIEYKKKKVILSNALFDNNKSELNGLSDFTFQNEELFLKKEFSFEEFKELYNFLFKINFLEEFSINKKLTIRLKKAPNYN